MIKHYWGPSIYENCPEMTMQFSLDCIYKSKTKTTCSTDSVLQNGEWGNEYAGIFSLVISNTKFCEKTNTITKISPDLKTPSIQEDRSFAQNVRAITSALDGMQRSVPLQKQYKGRGSGLCLEGKYCQESYVV